MESSKTPLDLNYELRPYLTNWPWFVLSVLIALSIAYIYLRYQPLSFETTASILIKDEGNPNLSQMAMFQDLAKGQFQSVNLENEIKVLKSRPLAERTVKQLNLNIQYFNDGRIRTSELYERSPIKLEVITPEKEWPNGLPPLLVTPKSLTEFTIGHLEAPPETHMFGEKFQYKGIEYLLHTNTIDDAALNQTTRVVIRSVQQTAASYKSQFHITPEGKQSSIINIQLTSSIPDKSEDVIDELIRQFNLDAIEDKNLVSKNTAEFIDERLEIIWEELDSVETGKVTYKEEQQLVDLYKQGDIFLSNANDYNQRLQQVQTERSQVNAIIRYLESGSDSSLLPGNLGVADGSTISLIQQYNQLVLERNQLLANTTETHPTIIRLNKQLESLKSNVMQGLQNAKQALDIQLEDLSKQERFIGSQLAGIPVKEKDFTNIERQQEIKQTLYLYLLEKREEASIALAVTEPKAKIVESAFTIKVPVSPKPSVVFLTALVLGGLVPFSFIYLKRLLDNKIRKRTDITDYIPNASILGEIPKVADYTTVKRNDLGMTAEAFRVLRNNMRFADLLKDSGQAKIILVTSSIKGEGKTTVSTNLALTLSYTGKKVLLVGADLRDPRIHYFYTKRKRPKGLVNYIIDETTSIEDFIITSNDSEHLDVLQSGDIPPNPEEILTKDRFQTFLDEVRKKYDFVILDTAPTLLVADTLLISDKADATLYVVRAGKTGKEFLTFIKELQDDEKLNNVNFVLNNVDYTNYGYGYGGKYGYGYGYGKDQTLNPWERFKRIILNRY